jgi:hypothetical protein
VILYARLEYWGEWSQMTPWGLDVIYTDGRRERFGFYMGSWRQHADYLYDLLKRKDYAA